MKIQPKESRKNFTFNMYPSTQALLVMIAQKKDRSQAKTLEMLIREKAHQLKIKEN